MKYLKLILILLGCEFSLLAGDWYFGTALNGSRKEFFGTVDMHSKFIDGSKRSKDYWQRRLAKTESSLSVQEGKINGATDKQQRQVLQDDFYKLQNNKARCLILLGQVDEALEILLILEKKFQGESRIAENLAVCYEKKKDYKKAIACIQLAIARNSLATYSNMWVYEKILITREKLSENPDYLKTNSVIGFVFSKDKQLKAVPLSKMENFQKRWELGAKAKQIRDQIQLQQQLNHSAKDPIIASLIEELGTLYAVCEVCEVALPVFKKALKFGHPYPETIQNRVKQMETLIAANPDSMSYSRSLLRKIMTDNGRLVTGVLLILLLLIGCAWWKVRRSREPSSE